MTSFGSVCSGIEAASVAWEPLSMRAAWLAEIEPFPSAVLDYHWPKVENLGDMCVLPELLRDGSIYAPDVLVGGTPCQAFSVAGARKGLADARGQLTLKYVEILNAIDECRAAGDEAVAVWENVPGVLSSKDNAFGCFLGALVGEDRELQPTGKRWSNAGCVSGPQRTVAWRILDAQYFGVAQRRRRVFVVASARDGFDPRKVLFESEGLRRDTAPSREAGEETTAKPARSAGSHGEIVGSLCARDFKGVGNQYVGEGKLVVGVGGVENRTPAEQGKQWPADIAATLNASFGDKQGLEDQHALGGASWFVPAVTCFDSRQGPAYTLDQTQGQAVSHDNLVRRLTPTECARLQGFPDHHARIPWRGKSAEDCPDGPQYKAYGNSMAVPVLTWIGTRLMKELNHDH